MKIDAYKTEQPQLVAEHPAFRNSCMHLAHLLLLLSLIVLVSVSGSNLHKRKDKGEEKKKDEDERDSRDIVVKSGTFKVRNTSVKEGETRLDDSSSGSNSQSSSQSGEDDIEEDKKEDSKGANSKKGDIKKGDIKKGDIKGGSGKKDGEASSIISTSGKEKKGTSKTKNSLVPKSRGFRNCLPGKKALIGTGLFLGTLTVVAGVAYVCCDPATTAGAFKACVEFACKWGLDKVVSSCPVPGN